MRLIFCLTSLLAGSVRFAAAAFPAEPMATAIANITSNIDSSAEPEGAGVADIQLCQAAYASPDDQILCAINGTIGQRGNVPENMW